MCEFHDCNCNGLGDTWWTDKCTYFSSIDACSVILKPTVIKKYSNNGYVYVVLIKI